MPVAGLSNVVRLELEFFARPAAVVAPDLLNKILWHETPDGVAAVRIVETEAYGGEDDPGSHGYRGMTRRNEVMFGPPGRAYVYFTYGMHYCLNFVTDVDGVCSAVLIRAGEPIVGADLMRERRKKKDLLDAASGPAKLTQALGVGRAENGADLTKSPLGVGDDGLAPPKRPARGSRVGIRRGAELLWRFAVRGNPHVSRPRP